MRKIKYFQIDQVIESSTPIDTPDTHIPLDSFEKRESAEIDIVRLEAIQFRQLKKKYSYHLAHTSYIIKERELVLK